MTIFRKETDMKTILDVLGNPDFEGILTQFNEYDYPTALGLIAMCVEEYCKTHDLNATQAFKELLETNLAVTEAMGRY